MGKKSKSKFEKHNVAANPAPTTLLSAAGGVSKTLYIQALIIFLFAFALYANTLGHDYAVDDTIVIIKNSLTTQGFEGIPKIMTTDAFYGFFGENYKFVAGGRYRPLSIVTFAIEWELFGRNPFISHLINIILYGFTGVIILFMLHTLFKTPIPNKFALTVPFLAAMLFIAHPLHTEAVANIKGRDEIMGFLFSALTLWLAVLYVLKRNAKFLIGAIGLYILALFSKENSVTFLAVIPLAFYFFTQAKLKDYAITLLPLLVITGVFIMLRQSFTGVEFTAETMEILNNPFVNATLAEKYATISNILGRYLKLLFIPYPLTHDYYPNQIPIINWGNPAALLPLFINLGLIGYAIATLRKKDLLSFSILYYFITLSIVTNVVVNVGTTMSERFLYMPSLGFCIAIPVILIRLHNYLQKKNLTVNSTLKTADIVGVTGVLVLLFSIQTVARNPAWENDFTLFSKDVQVSDNSAKVRNALGGELVNAADTTKDEAKKQQYLQEAVVHLNKAIEIHPTYTNAYLLMGNAQYKITGNPDVARQYYSRTLTYNPDYFDGNYNMGVTYLESNKPGEAIPFLRKAVSIKPEKFETYHHLGEAYMKAGKPDSAIIYYNNVIAMRPDLTAAIYYKIGSDYGKIIRDMDRSIQYLTRAVELEPNNPVYNEDLGVAYGFKGEFQEAIKAFERVLQIQPDHAKVYLNLSITYKQLGQEQKANEYMQKAYQIDPSLRPK